MADNPYINKVEANNQTLIDLTSDTATAGDVLEGRTLHLASGAPATGTYRPSDEIEARLVATVGHSSKNLFDRKLRQGTVANTTTASSVCSTTIIKTTNGATHRFKCFDNNFAFRVYGLNEAGKQQILSGSGVTAANRLFDSDYVFSDTYEHTNDNSNIVAYAIMLRKTSTPGQEDWINITPSDVPNDILMVVESPLTIDTFEPYVTPTDEKKQDKPVELDPTVLTWNIADIQSKYTHIQIICECIDTGATPNWDLYDVVTIPTVIFGRTANADKFMAFASEMTMSGFDSVIFTESNGNVSAYIDPSPARGTRTIIQIIGIPK